MSRRFLFLAVCSVFLLGALPFLARASVSKDTRVVCEWLLLQEVAERQIAPGFNAAVEAIEWGALEGMLRGDSSESAVVDGMLAGLLECQRDIHDYVVILTALKLEYKSRPALIAAHHLANVAQKTESAFDEAIAAIESAPGDVEGRLQAAIGTPELTGALEQMERAVASLEGLQPPAEVFDSARRLLRETE